MEQFLSGFFQFNAGNLLTIIAFIAGGISFVNTMKLRVDGLSARFDSIENKVDDLGLLVVGNARLEERVAFMDQRMLAQGQRIDSTATLINGRLEAINNIVAGHTAQLNNLPRYAPRKTQEETA